MKMANVNETNGNMKEVKKCYITIIQKYPNDNQGKYDSDLYYSYLGEAEEALKAIKQ